MPVRLFIGNLPYNSTEAELRELFSAAGPVSYISLPTDRETGQPRGFAFIEFSERAQAEAAVRQFNNQLFKGRPIAVSEARAREDRPSSVRSARPLPPRATAPHLTRPAATSPEGEPDAAAPSAPGSKRSRDFGPDALPRARRNKGKSGARPERGPKGPMREMVRGQFFGGNEDADDFDDEADDIYEEEPAEESIEANLTSPQNEQKDDDQE